MQVFLGLPEPIMVEVEYSEVEVPDTTCLGLP